MANTNIYSLDEYRTGTDDVTYHSSRLKTDTTEVDHGTETPMDTASLYSYAGTGTSPIARALVLIEEANEYLSRAIAAAKSNDEIDSDNEAQHFYALLPELFCCRDISEGFGSIINAIYNGLTNQLDREILTLIQLNKVSQLLTRLQSEPFLEIDQAIDLIIELEESGLNIKPQHLEKITEILCAK